MIFFCEKENAFCDVNYGCTLSQKWPNVLTARKEENNSYFIVGCILKMDNIFANHITCLWHLQLH